ncbi:tRNA lysidine(34) synthetase TilS [Christiangramia sp. SM2212]|uniref:tRNA(Ile)-lysidine synthase n=1 Tax=Christiangramia sediminicola TaxID=3073267 RepID=A0ABU1EQN1_9FLAO|nr:tRNA lysidine(34) synthetase TilS [Christiangramia sp. SM2212]MDR5590695.1 tRNA lysidine(34) synthetase TilS [Christiangramia sp. SM2212]
MEKSFKNLIKSDYPYICGAKLLVAVSGGVDSVVLAHLCHSAKLDFAIAHCNFNLRAEESDGDEKFVVDLADSFEVEVFTESFDTIAYAENHGISVQMAARDLRYEWFSELSSSIQFDYTLTAHHANDNLETFLINLIRGTGPEGLTGIKKERNEIVRPLLPYTRSEIENFARKKNYKWREDSSNSLDKYMRNKIRHQIVPVMEELNPQLLDSFAKTQAHLQESMDLVEDYISLLYPKLVQKDSYGYSIDIVFLKKVPNQKQILYQLLKSFGFTEWNDVYDLMEAQTGKMVLSDTHRLIKDREKLLLTEHNDKTSKKEYKLGKEEELVMIPEMGTFHISEVEKIDQVSKTCIYVPERKLQFPLTIRKWKKGDFFHPFGMKGKKKLSDFFKDEKFSLPEKEHTWILCSGEDIVWIINHRADNRFAVEKSDSRILKICIT